MLKSLKEFSGLKSKIAEMLGKDAIDIVLFGSAARGKEKPNDHDICIILKSRISPEKINDINRCFKENIHLSFLTVDSFFNNFHSLAKTVLYEGISLISKKPLLEKYGISSHVMYTYDLSGENKSKKVRFVYLLKGRKKGEGMIKSLKGEFISPGTFIIPLGKDQEMIDIFNRWGIRFKRKKVMLMS